MRAGRLNKRVSLQLQTLTGIDDWGNPTGPGFVEQFQAYASIEPAGWKTLQGAAETILAGAKMNYDLVDIEMHPDPRLQTGVWRVVYTAPGIGELIYDVKATRTNNKGDRAVLVATVGASNG